MARSSASRSASSVVVRGGSTSARPLKIVPRGRRYVAARLPSSCTFRCLGAVSRPAYSTPPEQNARESRPDHPRVGGADERRGRAAGARPGGEPADCARARTGAVRRVLGAGGGGRDRRRPGRRRADARRRCCAWRRPGRTRRPRRSRARAAFFWVRLGAREPGHRDRLRAGRAARAHACSGSRTTAPRCCWYWALLGVVATACSGAISAMLQATGGFGRMSMLTLANTGLTAILAVALALAGDLTLMTALVVLGIGTSLATFALGVRLLPRRLEPATSRIRCDQRRRVAAVRGRAAGCGSPPSSPCWPPISTFWC